MRISIRPEPTTGPGTGLDDPARVEAMPVTVTTPSGDVFHAGVLSRVGGLWKDAMLAISRDGETVTAQGMDHVVAALRRISGDGSPVVVLQLHPGYLGVYDGGVFPSARIMRTSEGWRMRRFEPHQSLLFDNPESALEAALEQA